MLSRTLIRRLLPLALTGLVAVGGCASEDDGLFVNGPGNTGNTGETGGSGVEGQIPQATPTPSNGNPGSTPTPAPTPTPTPIPTPTPTDITGGTDTETTPAPLPTIGTGETPTPGATPIGTLSNPFAIAGAQGLAVAPNSASPWVLNQSKALVLNDQGSTGESYATGLSQPALIATAEAGELWIANAGDNTLHLVTQGLQGLTRTGHYAIDPAPVALAVDETEAWTAHAGGTLNRLTRASGTVTSFAVTSPTAIALGTNAVWVVSASNNQLYRVSRADGAKTSFAVGNQPVAVGVDRTGTVWTANAASNSLSRLAGGSGAATTIALAGSPTALAIDTDRVWVGLSSPSRLAWYGLDGSFQGSIPLPAAPGPMAIDAYGKVWLVTPSSQNVYHVWGR
ncbi:hypothetical protein J7643_00855 [bacterium]|nr:hypothetical protein [bacterium]